MKRLEKQVKTKNLRLVSAYASESGKTNTAGSCGGKSNSGATCGSKSNSASSKGC